jgi:5-methylcytosine-specific restriction endonuclease McrA
MEGTRFNKLTAIHKIKMGNRFSYRPGYGTWLFKCDCGNEVIRTWSSVKRSREQSCGCVRKEFDSKRLYKQKPMKKWKDPKEQNFNITLNSYKKKMEYEFSLTDDQVWNLIYSLCHYCGRKHSNTRRIKRRYEYTEVFYNGIDRKDNLKGYTVDNCVTACKHCNLAKRGLSYENFKSLIYHIFNNLNLQQDQNLPNVELIETDSKFNKVYDVKFKDGKIR